jgi:hypothetical protein
MGTLKSIKKSTSIENRYSIEAKQTKWQVFGEAKGMFK